MSWELAEFMMQQVGVALLRASEGVMYKARSPYRFPGDECREFECAEILYCREGEIFPLDSSEIIESPPYLCEWAVQTEMVFQSHARLGGIPPMRKPGVLGERMLIWCPDPSVFGYFFDVATDAGFQLEVFSDYGEGWYCIF